jgi:hypothetical protein
MKNKSNALRLIQLGLVIAVLPFLAFKKEDVQFMCFPLKNDNCIIGQGEAGAVLIRFNKAPASLRAQIWKGPIIFKADDNERLFWTAFIPAFWKLSPGEYLLHIFAKEDTGRETEFLLPIVIEQKDYPVEELTLPKEMVELSPEALKRVIADNRVLIAAMTEINRDVYWEGAFISPVNASMDTNFGTQRIINHIPKSPHNGADMAVAEGTEVAATNAGRVTSVYEGYLTGKSVIIDHGGGLYSVYFHLSEIEVAKGDTVSKGKVIALSGATGMVSGPHLHFSIRLDSTYINPKTLLDASQWAADTLETLKNQVK